MCKEGVLLLNEEVNLPRCAQRALRFWCNLCEIAGVPGPPDKNARNMGSIGGEHESFEERHLKGTETRWKEI